MMDTKRLKKVICTVVDIVAILAMSLSMYTIVAAAPASPFVGHWTATDVDGGVIRLTIGLSFDNQYNITWTEDYFSFCDGNAGIVRGHGWLNEEDPNLLEADLRLICLSTGSSVDFNSVWRYHANTRTLSSSQNAMITIWYRDGKPSPPAPPLNLRVNYGDNWVESFYAAGHTAWVTVTGNDESTVKGTAELFTEPKEYWNGEPGFQSMDSSWYDVDGNLMENPPNIQPDDWVFGWVDNGASARVQIGTILGMINLDADSIEGTILADWFSEEVSVECFPWGAPEPTDMKYDSVLPNGADPYTCSWVGEWDIVNGQTVGVGYFGSDGNWVANAFRNPRFIIFPEWRWYDGMDWPDGMPVTITVEGKPECATSGTSSGNFFNGGFPEGCDVVVGDTVTFTDGVTIRTHTVRNLAITDADAETDKVTGTADPDAQLNVFVYDNNISVQPTVDGSGIWTADFGGAGFDLVQGMAGRAEISDAYGNATSVEWVIPTRIYVTDTADVVADDGLCTLREAVIAANTNNLSGSAEGECPAGRDNTTDTIILSTDHTYSLTIDSTYENESMNGDLDIWNNTADVDVVLTVDGSGMATVSQDATVDDRVIENLGATVLLTNLVLTGGSEGGIGGGILNSGELRMNTCEVDVNTAGWSGGGIFNTAEGTLDLASSKVLNNVSSGTGGGGIANEGAAVITTSVISGNTGNHDGGGIANNGMLTVDDSRISTNSTPAGGGGLFNTTSGNVLIQNHSEVSENSAGSGGGLFNYGILSMVESSIIKNTADYGGGIDVWSGTFTLDTSIVTDNLAENDGGGIHTKGTGTTIIQNNSVIYGNTAGARGGGIAIWDSGIVTISGSTVSNNLAGTGGGIANLPSGIVGLDTSVISGNSANDGGGLANWSIAYLANSTVADNSAAWGGGMVTYGGYLTVDASVVSGNTAVNDAGGVFIKDSATVNIQNGSQILNNQANWGGGISSWSSSLTVDSSTISSNTAGNGGGGLLVHDGGTAAIQNGSLVSSNSSGNGGGIANWGPSVMVIDSSVIANNSATSQAGGGTWNSGNLTISNTKFSGNSAGTSGGGIFNNGVLSMTESALMNNSATYDGDAVLDNTDTADAATVLGTCIVGNGNTAVFNNWSALQDFTGNWWGDSSGPSGVGPGLGDSVGVNIDFSGWLDAAPTICAP